MLSRFPASLRAERTLLVIVLGALGLRLFLLFYLKAYVVSDDWNFGWEAGRIAKSLASGEGFSSPFRQPSGPTAWLAPVYPYFLSVIFRIFGVYSEAAAVATLTANCLFSALTCIPLFLIGKHVFGRPVGIMAAVAFAVYPPSIWHSILTIWNTNLFVLLGMLMFHWLLILPQRLHNRSAVLFGSYLGLLALVQPVILSFYAFVGVWLLLKPMGSFQGKLARIGLIYLAMFATLAPWVARNYVTFGRAVVKSTFGFELKLGNSHEAWENFSSRGKTTIAPWMRGHPAIDEREFQLYRETGETNYLLRFRDEAWSFISANPNKFLRLTLNRISQFWLGDPGTMTKEVKTLELPDSEAVLSVVPVLKLLCYVLPLPFAVIGVFLAIKKGVPVSPFLAYLILYPGPYYITHAIAHRYRYPVEPLILVLASFGVYGLWSKAYPLLARAGSDETPSARGRMKTKL